MTEFFKQLISSQCSDFSIVIEDDGRVCYAYLLEGKNIRGDVWLYNQAEDPLTVDFKNKDEFPFLNPVEYIRDEVKIRPILNEEDVEVKWTFGGDDCAFKEAKIFIHNQLLAVIKLDAKPGWSMNVKKDGPLAKVLLNE